MLKHKAQRTDYRSHTNWVSPDGTTSDSPCLVQNVCELVVNGLDVVVVQGRIFLPPSAVPRINDPLLRNSHVPMR